MKNSRTQNVNLQHDRPAGTPERVPGKATGLRAAASASMREDYDSLREAAQAVQRIRLTAQRELEIARKLRADAMKYQRETETRARSEAHQLVLKARLSSQREIEELIRKASEEIQKVLADIRVIRITAQEELAAQRKFTDAARLCSMSLAITTDQADMPPKAPRKRPTGVK